MASVITPNIPEAEVLAEMEIRSEKIWWKQQRRLMKCIIVQFCAKADTV